MDIRQDPAHGCRTPTQFNSVLWNLPLIYCEYRPLGVYASYSFSSVASTVAVAPALTVMVLSQVLKPGFPSLILWSPTFSRRDEGVLPINLSSTIISAPSGVDFRSTAESAGSAPFPFCGAVVLGVACP